MNIKKPPMPEPDQTSYVTDSTMRRHEVRSYTSRQLAARDAQWLELVGPVVEAANKMLKQFTKMPSTLKDSEARCQLHSALRQITED